MSETLKRFKDAGLIGCLNDTGVTSENYKDYAMFNSLTFCIPGEPRTKLRPRFARFRGNVRTYDSQSEEKQTAKWQLKARMAKPPLAGPVSINLIFVMPKPKSRPKAEVYHSVKPDIDNLIKWILDVANGILWEDDKQVVSVGSVKIYGAEPRTIITASEIWESS